ncbi:MAG: hypothetical protein P8X74_23730 [Reinekea sp.]|jgi:hypothetical protein
MLNDWVELSKSELEKKGFTVTMSVDTSCTSVDLDCDKVVGTICFWEPNQFEFQFNYCDSSDVVVESVELGSINEISEYFRQLLIKMGIM